MSSLQNTSICIAWPNGGPIELSLPVPAGQVSFVDVLPQLYAIGDAVIARSLKDYASEGKRPSCAAGCGHCCHFSFGIGYYEALGLLRLIEGMPQGKRRFVLQGMQENIVKLRKRGLLEKIENVYADENCTAEDKKYYTETYRKLNLACPFLMNDRCGIYEYRPMVCREYVVTSPAENCKWIAHGSEVSALKMGLPTASALVAFDGFKPHYTKLMPMLFLEHWENRITNLPQDKDEAEGFILRYVSHLSGFEEMVRQHTQHNMEIQLGQSQSHGMQPSSMVHQGAAQT